MSEFKGSEHDFLTKDKEKVHVNSDCLSENLWERLDLKEENGYVKAGYVIGVQWLRNKENIVKVSPKKDNIDFFTILDTCLKDPVVGQHMDKCYSLNSEEPKIPVNQESRDLLNLFLIHHFLNLVKQITRNGLKKGFTKVSENLTAKIRGKILVNPTLRHNHTKARPDKVYCQYQRFTTDCLENQILASTLDAIQKRLKVLSNDNLKKGWSQLLKQLKPYFEGVQRIPLNNRVFKQVKTHRFFRNYQQALDVAEQIHKNITQTTKIEGSTHIHPFTIDMPELFERYCEAKLRAKYAGVKAGYEKHDNSETEAKPWELRPDFLLPDKDMILDSKYKFYGHSTQKRDMEYDYKQMALYSIHKGIRDKIGFEKPEVPVMVLIYPEIFETISEKIPDSLGKFAEINLEDSNLSEVKGFRNLFKITLKLPTKDNKEQANNENE